MTATPKKPDETPAFDLVLDDPYATARSNASTTIDSDGCVYLTQGFPSGKRGVHAGLCIEIVDDCVNYYFKATYNSASFRSLNWVVPEGVDYKKPHTVSVQGRWLIGGGTTDRNDVLAVWGSHKGVLYAKEIFVHREARGQGVGEALFAFLKAEAVRRGIGRIDLTTDPGNDGAQRFYERLGGERTEKVAYRFWLDQPSARTFG